MGRINNDAAFFMSYVRGEALLPAAIEDYVAADAPVRVIDAFVDGLDVNGLGFGRAAPTMALRCLRAASAWAHFRPRRSRQQVPHVITMKLVVPRRGASRA